MIDASQLPPGTPLWITSAVVMLSALMLFSERAAKLQGPLGALARWWDQRQQDEVDRLLSTDNRIEAAAERRYGSRMAEMEESIKTLRADLEAERQARRDDRVAMTREHEAEKVTLRLDRDLYASWSEHLLAWWRAQSQWLAANGIQLPAPPLPTFAQFRKDFLDARS